MRIWSGRSNMCRLFAGFKKEASKCIRDCQAKSTCSENSWNLLRSTTGIFYPALKSWDLKTIHSHTSLSRPSKGYNTTLENARLIMLVFAISCFKANAFRNHSYNKRTIVWPHWVDHILKICILNLRYAKTRCAKNAKNVKGMPFSMYGDFYLITFSSVHDSKF